MRCVMGIPVRLAAFAVALCAFTQADAIENASGVAISAPLDLSREVRPAPRPPIIVNAVPPALPAKNVASSQAQPLGHAACSAKRSPAGAPPCREWQKIPPAPPAS